MHGTTKAKVTVGAQPHVRLQRLHTAK